MSTLKLIEFVRAIRANGHRYGAVDKGGEFYSFSDMPERCDDYWHNICVSHQSLYIGMYNLSCSWKDTLIDVNKIKVK